MTVNTPTVTAHHDEKKGLVLVADKNIQRGEVVIEEEAELLDWPSMHSVQFTPSKHAHTFDGGVLKFAEHMCEPNCGIDMMLMAPDDSHSTVERASLRLIALKNISRGETVGFNYNTSDWHFSHPFQCECTADSCAGEIRGFSKLSQKQRQSLLDSLDAQYIAQGILRNLERTNMATSVRASSSN